MYLLLRCKCSLILTVITTLSFIVSSSQTWADDEQVGYAADGRVVTPVNQVLTPWGDQLDLPGMRPQAVAISPNGDLLVTAGKSHDLVVVDPSTQKIKQRVSLPGESQVTSAKAPVSDQVLHPDKEGQLSYTGLIFAPSGKRIYMSNVDGSIKVFAVSDQGGVAPQVAWRLPEAGAPRRDAEIPTGLATTLDGTRLYVCGNLSNQLLELDTETGKLLRSIPVGVAPYDVVLVSDKAYVSNWGGRHPGDHDLTGPAGRGTVVRVDPVRHIANEGSVSVVNLQTGVVEKELITGLHASGLAVSPQGEYVVCCNASSDFLSVIDTHTDKIVAKVWAKANPAELWGASPNAACFDAEGAAAVRGQRFAERRRCF